MVFKNKLTADMVDDIIFRKWIIYIWDFTWGFNHVQHKLAYTVTKEYKKLEILYISRRGIALSL